MHRRLPLSFALPLLFLASAGLLGLSLALGSVPISAGELVSALATDAPSLARDIVLELRLPRAMAAFAVGGLLALSGAILQVLLRNPLADPYVLGVSGGASVAALVAIMLSLPAAAVDGFAALGALVACLLVFALAQGPGAWTPTRLRGMVFWLLGDLSGTRRWPWLLGLLAFATVAGVVLGRHLNVLSRGAAQAATVGMDVRRLQAVLFVGSSVLTGCAVSAAGSIGFVGLVTPHLARLALGSDNRVVLPAAALLGGALLMAADLAARVLIAPRQLPVGALTALVGVPLFLLLMYRQRP